MSNGEIFWGRKASNNNRVTTRELGDIPGCSPAVDVFHEIPLEHMQSLSLAHAAQYSRLCKRFNDDPAFKWQDWKNYQWPKDDPYFTVIRNPAKPYRKDW